MQGLVESRLSAILCGKDHQGAVFPHHQPRGAPAPPGCPKVYAPVVKQIPRILAAAHKSFLQSSEHAITLHNIPLLSLNTSTMLELLSFPEASHSQAEKEDTSRWWTLVRTIFPARGTAHVMQGSKEQALRQALLLAWPVVALLPAAQVAALPNGRERPLVKLPIYLLPGRGAEESGFRPKQTPLLLHFAQCLLYFNAAWIRRCFLSEHAPAADGSTS